MGVKPQQAAPRPESSRVPRIIAMWLLMTQAWLWRTEGSRAQVGNNKSLTRQREGRRGDGAEGKTQMRETPWRAGNGATDLCSFSLQCLQIELGVHFDGGCLCFPTSDPDSTFISLSRLTFEGEHIYDPCSTEPDVRENRVSPTCGCPA